MFIDFILLSHPYDKPLGDAQSFNFTFFQLYKRKTARRLTRFTLDIYKVTEQRTVKQGDSLLHVHDGDVLIV